MLPVVLAPSVPKYYLDKVKLIDKNLDIAFNCDTERWDVYRLDKYGRQHWVLRWENEDGSFRQLDPRIFAKLREMDIISRYGSIANYENHLDSKLAKWKEGKDKEDNHELMCDIKDSRHLWQRAAENFRSGIVNDPPEQRDRKIISCPKGEVR